MTNPLFAWQVPPLLVAPVIYDHGLVLLSVVIATLGGAAAMQLMGLARQPERFGHLIARSAYGTAVFTLGISVWSMHFIGMLAADICQDVHFDSWITALSMLPSILASALGLRVFARSETSDRAVITSGIWVGVGIGLMHYSGMGAMRMESILRYDPLWFGGSLVVAITLAIAGLGARQVLVRRWRLSPLWASVVAGAILGLAISGMHYTAMQAALFIGPFDASYVRWSHRQLELSLVVAAVTFIIFGLAWGTVAIAAYRGLNVRLRERESLLSDILQNLPGAVMRLPAEPGSRPILVSPGIDELTGRAAHACEQGQWALHDVVEPADLGEFQEALDRTLQGAQRQTATIRLKHTDGHVRWAQVRFQASQAAHAHRVLDLYLTDVTVELAARTREQQLLHAIDNVMGRAVLSPEGEFQQVNVRLAQTLGYTPGELVGQPHRRVWPGNNTEDIDGFWSALRAGQAQPGEFARLAKDGTLRYLKGWYQPLLDAEGAVYAVLKLVIDVSERVHMVESLQHTQAELEQALASRSAFFANVSHEIRTPMNAVVGFAELLREGLTNDKQTSQAQSILDAARALLRILNDLLDAAKLERGEFSLLEAPFALDRLVRDLVSQFGVTASRKGLDLRLEWPDDVAPCRLGDGDRVRQILTNLLGNALKFTEKGQVTLGIARDGDRGVQLWVRDTGIGIPPERQRAIFDPFVQADAGTARRYGGTGLGMSIVKHLVERMGGDVQLHSVLGQGTTVCVVLPLPVAPASECSQQTAYPEPLQPVRPLRILAADDVRQNRELLVALLERAGHRVTVFEGGQGLLASYQENPAAWDVILLDLHMPDMDGLAACQHIRTFEQERGLARIPVFALSASVLEQDRQAARQVGMDDFLEKPINLAQLHKALQQVPQRSGFEPQVVDALMPHASISDPAFGALLWGGQWMDKVWEWVTEVDSAWADFEAWSTSDWHRIVGVASNLALPSLAQAAKACENASEHDRPAAQRAARVQWDAIKAWLGQRTPRTSAGSSGWAPALLAPAELSALLDRLAAACTLGEIDQDALDHLLAAEPLRTMPLHQALQAFDFDAALSTIRDWNHDLSPLANKSA